MFPANLLTLLILASRSALSQRFAKLRQKLIDAEYVLEERVENYEPGQDMVQSGTATPISNILASRDVVDQGEWEDTEDVEEDGEDGEGQDSEDEEVIQEDITVQAG